jgi:hypothetical protein
MSTSSGEKIRCPKCEWEPSADDVWACTCYTVWNTFDTYGQCPNCKKVWKETQCQSCSRWSPHPDWYADLSDVVIGLVEEQEAKN